MQASEVVGIEGWFSPIPAWWTAMLGKIGFKNVPEPQDLAPVFKIFDNRFSVGFFEKNLYYTKGDGDLF